MELGEQKLEQPIHPDYEKAVEAEQKKNSKYLSANQIYMAHGYAYPMDGFWDSDSQTWIIKNKVFFMPYTHVGLALSVHLHKAKKAYFNCYAYDAVARFIATYVRPGDYISILGYWDHRRIELPSYHGKTRIRDWYRVVINSATIIPMVKKKNKKPVYSNTAPWENPNDFRVSAELPSQLKSDSLLLSDTLPAMSQYLDPAEPLFQVTSS
jgi:hypothetical protein